MDCVLWKKQHSEDFHLLLYGSNLNTLFNEEFGLASRRYFSQLSGALEDWISFLILPCGFCVICGLGRQFYLFLDSCSRGEEEPLSLRGKFRYCT